MCDVHSSVSVSLQGGLPRFVTVEGRQVLDAGVPMPHIDGTRCMCGRSTGGRVDTLSTDSSELSGCSGDAKLAMDGLECVVFRMCWDGCRDCGGSGTDSRLGGNLSG